MCDPFKDNMKLVTFLLVIQMGYITAKSIETPRPCNGSAENDPRSKRSDVKESDIADTMEQHPDDLAARQMYSKPTIGKNNNGFEKTNEFASNSNTLPQKLPLDNNVKETTNGKGNIILNKLITTMAPLQPIYYKTIDPKDMIISGLSQPKTNKNMSNITSPKKTVTDFKETKQLPLDSSNLAKPMNVVKYTNVTDTEGTEVVINSFDTDLTNIRELRGQLLDHLLDYFLNIIKEENYIRNDTRKNNGKDRMKVEDKLRNYYDPHHLDLLLVNDDDEDYNLDASDYHSNIDSEEDLVDNLKHNDKSNITYIDPLNTLENDTEKVHSKSTENDKNQTLNAEDNLYIINPDGEFLNVNFSEPVTSKYVNLFENENYSSNFLSNVTENYRDDFDSTNNVITTTQRSISNEALNEDTDPLNNSDEAVTNRAEYDYDTSVHTVKGGSDEDFSDSYEFQVVKNITVHEEDKHPIFITTENDRRKNVVNKEKYIESGALKDYKNKKLMRNDSTNTTTTDREMLLNKDDTLNDFGILHLSNENVDEVSPDTEDNLPDYYITNINKTSTKKSREDMKRKHRSENTYGKLVSKLIKKPTNKHICAKSFSFNFNINLI